jgi:hypothetical protein
MSSAVDLGSARAASHPSYRHERKVWAISLREGWRERGREGGGGGGREGGRRREEKVSTNRSRMPAGHVMIGRYVPFKHILHGEIETFSTVAFPDAGPPSLPPLLPPSLPLRRIFQSRSMAKDSLSVTEGGREGEEAGMVARLDKNFLRLCGVVYLGRREGGREGGSVRNGFDKERSRLNGTNRRGEAMKSGKEEGKMGGWKRRRKGGREEGREEGREGGREGRREGGGT